MTENRIYKRITAGYKADITYAGESCTGLIENLSENGVNVITDPVDDAVQFAPGEEMTLQCETPSGEVIELRCRIKWSGTCTPQNVRRRIGAEIIEPPWQENQHFL